MSLPCDEKLKVDETDIEQKPLDCGLTNVTR